MSMTSGFGTIDWVVVAAYLLGNAALGWYLSKRGARSARDYFLADGQMPGWLIAFSVLATTQSAATFLGGPDYGYRADYTYLAGLLGRASRRERVCQYESISEFAVSLTKKINYMRN